MKRECVAKQYTIEVDLRAIMDWDSQKENDNQWDDILHMQLDKIEGVENVDYNGHFGNYIWLTIEHPHDNKVTWDKIETLIFKAMVIPKIF